MLTEIVFRNPQATIPLRVDVNVECNTPDDKILANVLTNAKRDNVWIKTEAAHDKIAVICASGPSMGDTLEEARALQKNGATIFAMNGCAKFLYGHGIEADYQVIMDARPETGTLVGPAKAYLFASQVDTSLFEAKPHALLWHATHGSILVDEQEGFPKRDTDYCLIGSSVTVGCTSLALIYALGYRTIHIFGMDSSHRNGNGHAFAQTLNDGDPCTIVEYKEKEYICSFTMRAQIDGFLERYHQLKRIGCTIEMHGDGLLQEMIRNPLSESEKYQAMWTLPAYREIAPGEEVAARFVEIANPKLSDIVIDFGCGTGRGAKRIHDLTGCEMVLLDFAGNCLDSDMCSDWFTFRTHDLTQPLNMRGNYGFCTDVMEHIPPEQVDTVIQNIMDAAPEVFFQISLIDDVCGALIGHPLHLSVHSYEWWKEKFQTLGFAIKSAEDCGSTAIYYVVSKIN